MKTKKKSRHPFQWVSIEGNELLDALDEERIGDLVPRRAGLYVWRRSIAAPLSVVGDSKEFAGWIQKITEQPVGRVGRCRLSSVAWFEGLQVGGGGISSEKQRTLELLSRDGRLRRAAAYVVESVSDFLPTIYVGQTNNLQARTRQHLKGDTGLGPYLRETLELSWGDVSLQYMVLTRSEPSESVKANQELLEAILQSVLAPFATGRIG